MEGNQGREENQGNRKKSRIQERERTDGIQIIFN